MTQKNRKTIHMLYGVILALLIVAVGVCFIVSCVSIYKSGESRPFSRESVAAQFEKIAIPTYVCIAAVVGGIALNVALPLEKTKLRAKNDPKKKLDRLMKKIDLDMCEPDISKKIRMLILERRIAMIACAVVAIAAFVPVAIHLFNLDHFTVENLNGDVFMAIWIVLGASLVALGSGIACTLFVKYSFEEQIALATSVIAGGNAKAADKASDESKSARSRKWILPAVRFGLLGVGIVFVVLGIFNGGMRDVLEKAIAICTECIGLG